MSILKVKGDDVRHFFSSVFHNRRFLSVLLFLVLLRILAIPLLITHYEYKVGDIAKEEILASDTITYEDVKKTRFKRKEVKRNLPPMFVHDDAAKDKTKAKFKDFVKFVTRNIRSKPSSEQFSIAINQKFMIWLSPATLTVLKRGYNEQYLVRILYALYQKMHNYYFFNVRKDFARKYYNLGFVFIKGGKEQKFNPLTSKLVLFSPLDSGFLRRSSIKALPYLNVKLREALIEIVSKLAVPNARYNQEMTKIREEAVLSKIVPVTKRLKKGQIIVREGDLITEQKREMIQALNKYSGSIDIGKLFGLGIFVLIVYLLFAYHMQRYYNESLATSKRSLLVVVMLVLINLIQLVLLATVSRKIGNYPMGAFVPIAITAMSLAMLFGEQFSFFITLIVAFMGLLVTRSDFLSFAMIAGSGMISIYQTTKAKNRTDLWHAGFFAFLFSFCCLIAHVILHKGDLMNLINGIGIVFANCLLSSIIAVGLIPFFESFLGIPTRFKLLELADTNAPLLKRMLIEASGTYTHSIIVGNLSESAAENIGANALLARVGSYYHDVGKIELSTYFIENQQGIENKHDDLKPTMSRSVLIAHVKNGVELAKKEGLPQMVIDFIEQHHGKSLIKFFYQQALDDDQPIVSREDFRYPGPKPQTKETAIVMLADSVEAASKTLKNPTPQRIDNLVTDIIRNRFLAGDLNESPLTLRDLTIIANSFVKILNSLFHSRIEYPEEHNIRKAENIKKNKIGKKKNGQK